MKLVDFLNDSVVEAQARSTPLSHPNGTEAAILREARDGLYGRKKVFARIEKIPSRLDHGFARYSSSGVLPLQPTLKRVLYYLAPYHVAAGDYGIRSHSKWLLGENGGVNASHNHRGALQLGLSQDPVTGQAIAAADTDANNVSRTENVGIEPFNGFVDEDRVTDQVDRGCLGHHVEPPWRDKAIAHS